MTVFSQLFPVAADKVDPLKVYRQDFRPSHLDRPWVMINMVSAVDGATALDGTSTAIGGEADRLVFRAIRAVADVILVGAETVRAEAYNPINLPEPLVEVRRAHGQTSQPQLVVVSGSLNLDPSAALFRGTSPVRIFTGQDGSQERRRQLSEVAEVTVTFTDRVDIAQVLGILRTEHVGVVLVEGGPSLNAQLAGSELVDEICLTLAAKITSGRSQRILAGGEEIIPPYSQQLDRILVSEDDLFLRYICRRTVR